MTGLLLAFAASLAPPDEVDFTRDVRPILSDRCFKCHGPDGNARKAKLRLDTKDGLSARYVVVPGERTESKLWQRITHADASKRMPPPESKLSLTAGQIGILGRWIDAGARWSVHWSFQPIARPAPPRPDGVQRDSIDAFVLQRLGLEKLAPSPEAGRERLIRRVTLDLIGLPPTPDQVDAFLSDPSPGAFERVVDRLLASPAFGERMAWPWLDAARYADSNGYQQDKDRTMWPWRDWAIRALNGNMPFDRFTVLQLAGDLESGEPASERKLATGFCRNHMINGEGGRIAEENRVEYVFDQLETVGTVWLGLTFNCTRCHDHKFDPLTRRDYYGLFAFFNQTPVNGGGGNPQQAPVITVGVQGKPKVMVMEDLPAAKRRKTFMLEKGQYDQRREEVTAAVPAHLPPMGKDAVRNRLGLAKWLIDGNNPLTARVVVNGVWQRFFGVGLVKTAEDFGTQGERPSHPRLLDGLAADFSEGGWDLKRLCRRIVTSATYRQSSRLPAGAAERDPENRLLARGPRFRMPSWMLRDQALAASGLLVSRTGGPPVRPYQPGGVWAEASFGKIRYKQDVGANLYRRSLYAFWRRIIGPTMFFDSAARQFCTVRKLRTNTPLHALATLNGPTYVEAARAMARRAIASASADGARIDFAFRLVLARLPDADERAVLTRSIGRLRTQYRADPGAAAAFLKVGASGRDPSINPAEQAAWAGLCLTILNLDEALTKE